MHPLLAVTRFCRPAAGAEMGDPDLTRPPIIQYMTVKYMRDCVADQDLTPPGSSLYDYQKPGAGATHSFMDVYTWFKDRTRQIAQELALCMPGRQPDKHTIRTLEQMIRFMIVAQHAGTSETTFDQS